MVLILGFWDGSLAMGGLGLEQMKKKSERQNGQRDFDLGWVRRVGFLFYLLFFITGFLFSRVSGFL